MMVLRPPDGARFNNSASPRAYAKEVASPETVPLNWLDVHGAWCNTGGGHGSRPSSRLPPQQAPMNEGGVPSNRFALVFVYAIGRLGCPWRTE